MFETIKTIDDVRTKLTEKELIELYEKINSSRKLSRLLNGTWDGNKFENGELYLRGERQGIQAFPQYNCFLFTIQTWFIK